MYIDGDGTPIPPPYAISHARVYVRKHTDELVLWDDDTEAGELDGGLCENLPIETPRTMETQAPPPAPPQHAELLLHYALPRARREEILGDLEEDYYTEWLPKFGPREAQRLYWCNAVSLENS
jgi:hypothetical protein